MNVFARYHSCSMCPDAKQRIGNFNQNKLVKNIIISNKDPIILITNQN